MIDRFRQANTRRERSAVVAAIWDNVKTRGGRFLKKNEWRSLQSQQDFQGTGPGGDWYQLSDAQAKEKVAHAIRDACANSLETQSRRGSLSSVDRRGSNASGAAAAGTSSTSSEPRAQPSSSLASTTLNSSSEPLQQHVAVSETLSNTEAFTPAKRPAGDDPSQYGAIRKPTKSKQHKNNIYQNLQSLAQELKRDKARQQNNPASSASLLGHVDLESNFDFEPEPLYQIGEKKAGLKVDESMEPLAAAPFAKPKGLARMLKSDFEPEPHQQPAFAIAGASNDLIGAPASRSASTSPPALEQQQQPLPPAPSNLFMGQPQPAPQQQQQQPTGPMTYDTLPRGPFKVGSSSPARQRASSSSSSSSHTKTSIGRQRTPYPPSTLLQEDLFNSSPGSVGREGNPITIDLAGGGGGGGNSTNTRATAVRKKRKSPPLTSIQHGDMLNMDLPPSPLHATQQHAQPVSLLANAASSPGQPAGVAKAGDPFLQAIDDTLGPMSEEDTALQQQHDDPLMALLMAQRHHRDTRMPRAARPKKQPTVAVATATTATTSAPEMSFMGQHSEESRGSHSASSSSRKRAKTVKTEETTTDHHGDEMNDESEHGPNIAMI